MEHRKEIEIQGCVEVPLELSQDEFLDQFIAFLEERHWCFGGGVQTILDGYYMHPDGTKGTPVIGTE